MPVQQIFNRQKSAVFFSKNFGGPNLVQCKKGPSRGASGVIFGEVVVLTPSTISEIFRIFPPFEGTF
jgi:hypothetical protein